MHQGFPVRRARVPWRLRSPRRLSLESRRNLVHVGGFGFLMLMGVAKRLYQSVILVFTIESSAGSSPDLSGLPPTFPLPMHPPLDVRWLFPNSFEKYPGPRNLTFLKHAVVESRVLYVDVWAQRSAEKVYIAVSLRRKQTSLCSMVDPGDDHKASSERVRTELVR